MKILFYIPIIVSFLFSACRLPMSAKKRHDAVKRQKNTLNQNCSSEEGNSVYAGLNYLLDEPKSVSEKNFKKYFLSNYPNPFPLTTIRLCVVFQPNLPPCCRQTHITDSLILDAKQLDFLTDLVLKYSVFNKVQFNNSEKVKHLIVYLSRYRKSEFSVGFL